MKQPTPPHGNDEPDPGFMPLAEGAALVDIASEADAELGPFLEVGSYRGRSASYLGPVARQLGTVLFCVDDHRHEEEGAPNWRRPRSKDTAQDVVGLDDTLPVFRRTMAEAELEDAVVPIVGESSTVAKFWDRGLSLLFLNGGRSVEEVQADYSGWVNKVAVGGLLIINDVIIDADEDELATYEHLYLPVRDSGEFEEVRAVGSLRILCRLSEPKRMTPVR